MAVNDPLDRRKVFMGLPSIERDAALWNMLIDEISERVKVMSRVTILENENQLLKRELEGISHRKSDTVPLNTEQKIQMVLEKKSVTWIWYRDRVLASTLSAVHTVIILAILYFVFGGKIPTP